MSGIGVKVLSRLIDSIKEQTYNDYEIIVSDHSINNDIKEYCESKDIIYLRCEIERGNPATNTNNAIKKATGELIKIMNQDDFFYHKNSLERMVNQLVESNSKWVITACIHCNEDETRFYHHHVPYYPENDIRLIEGINTIGCPSVVMFVNDNNFFDNKVLFEIDCELFYMLNKKYGKPSVIKDALVCIRQGDKNLTVTMGNNDILLKNDVKYIKEKYNL